MSTPTLPPFSEVQAMASKSSPEVRVGTGGTRRFTPRRPPRALCSAAVGLRERTDGIEANQFALHSAIATAGLGVPAESRYAVTVNLTVPVWD